MSEYASRGGDRSYGHTSGGGHAPTHEPVVTPAARAADAIGQTVRQLDSIELAISAVRAAQTANDLAAWEQAKADLDKGLAHATQLAHRAHAREQDAAPEAKSRLLVAQQTLALYEVTASTLTDAPRGWSALARETEITAVLEAPIEHGVAVGMAAKEQALRTELALLSVADARHLIARLQRSAEGDPIAVAIKRFGAERRQRILSYLHGAPRRAAVGVTPRQAPAPSIELETVDTKIHAALEHQGIAEAIGSVATTIDGTDRRALARRLESYRQGSGDEIGARFVRLDSVDRGRVLASLKAAPSVLPDRLADLTSTSLHLAQATKLADAFDVQVTSINALMRAYGRARDALDPQGISEIGGTTIATLHVLSTLLARIDQQLASDEAPSGELKVLRARRASQQRLADTVNIAAAATFTPPRVPRNAHPGCRDGSRSRR